MSDTITMGGILAGGLARRMGGGDKGLRLVGGLSVLQRVVQRVGPQVALLALNANDDPERFASFALPVVADDLHGRLGPLAGILALLDWAAAQSPAAEWLLTVPADAPFLPRDLAARLHDAVRRQPASLACAASGGRSHPVVGLWPVRLRDDLRRAVTLEGVRKIDAFTDRHKAAAVAWPAAPVDPFFNVNTPEDLAEADRLSAAETVG